MADEPNVLIDGAVDRVGEITWWNRYLTRFTDRRYFANGIEFLKKGLLEVKGPLIEYIRPAAPGKKTLQAFAEEAGIHPALLRSLEKNLFSRLPPGTGRLYAHQEEAVRLFASDLKSDFIITVPTSGGKTEAFLIPILNHCLAHREAGLKAILIYPMKTLATDQFNRLLKYVSDINHETGLRLSFAIWDGDTPQGVADPDFPRAGYQAYNRPHQRGLQCPACKGDLILTRDETLDCQDCPFQAVWAKATRNAILAAAGNIDILITNPEALENMLISPDSRLQDLLGSAFSNPPLKYVVLDEAHVWRGTAGAAANLFVRRLRNMYSDRPVQFALISATISGPKDFAASLLEVPKDRIRAIEFTGEPINFDFENPDFSRIRPTNFEELAQVTHMATLITDDRRELLASSPALANALDTAIRLRLLLDNAGRLSPSELGSYMVEIGGAKDRESVLAGISAITQRLLQNPLFVESWKDHLSKTSPEVMALVKILRESAGKGALVYVRESELLEFIRRNSASQDSPFRAILATCLNLGRTANLLSDKYHLFVSPPYQVFYCSDCRWLAAQEKCPKCGKTTNELLCCSRCHTPHVLEKSPTQGEVQSTKGEDRDTNQEEIFEGVDDEESGADLEEPIFGVPTEELKPGTIRELNPTAFCNHRKVKPASVWYPTFITYLLSYLCRTTSSRKVLVFSDGRKTANTIVSTFQLLDNTLVAEQLFVRELVRNPNHELPLGEIRNSLLRNLKSYYYDFMMENADTKELKDFLRTYERQVVFPRSYLNNMPHLFGGVLCAPRDLLALAKDNNDLIIGYEIFSEFYRHYEIGFEMMKINFEGKTPSKLIQTLKRRLPRIPEEELRQKVLNWLGLFFEYGFVTSCSADKIHDVIVNSKLGVDQQKQVRGYFDSERALFETATGRTITPADTVLFQRRDDKGFENVVFGLVGTVAFCIQCMDLYPAMAEPSNCPNCGQSAQVRNRVAGGLIGSCDFGSTSPWSLDHWAREILDVAVGSSGTEDIPHVFAGVHTAEASQDIRGILEKGFKQEPAQVNVISATPTLELGVDIGSLDVIVQVGVPPTLTNYVQRCGRAGRVRGRPSFVWTILRNQNSIDAYHFEHLEEYLRELRPLHIPEPEELDLVVASQMVGEVLSFAARRANPDLFGRIMSVPDYLVSAEQICQAATLISQGICELATDPELGLGKFLPSRLDTIFGRPDIGEALFKDQASMLNLHSVAKRFFDGLIGLSAESVNHYRTTATWLSELGFFSSYRGSNEAVPIVSSRPWGPSSSSSILLVQDYQRAILENYPGPHNGEGAKFPYEGVAYIVKRIQATAQVDHVKICLNEHCILRFQPYRMETPKCPNCQTILVSRTILRPDLVYAEPVRRFGETRAEIAALPSVVGGGDWRAWKGLSVPAQIAYGRIECIMFTAAFVWTGRGKRQHQPSEVPLPGPIAVAPGKALDFLGRKQVSTEFGHPGYRLETLGFAIKTPLKDLKNKLGRTMFAGVISLQQAARLAASIAADAELGDLGGLWSLEADSVTIYVFDTKTRGSGVAKKVFARIGADADRFSKALREISSCPHCTAYCSRCLLVERTPPHYVENGLLDRNLVERLLR